jgi:hypothetical protein
MPRLRQVPRDEAHPGAQALYRLLFGDRDPVASPGTATGTPGNWWTVFALVPERVVEVPTPAGGAGDPMAAVDAARSGR